VAQFVYTVTRRSRTEGSMVCSHPSEVLDYARSLPASGSQGSRSIDRVQVYDEAGDLVLDTEPEACEACGRDEHAGFREGLPYCHRHLSS
jgi:hypothetical protein